MDKTALAYNTLIGRFCTWAQESDDIRGAFVIRSRARTDHPADEWSDLDLVIITTDPERYIRESAWLEELGHVWLTSEYT